jgi:hypothetical protein
LNRKERKERKECIFVRDMQKIFLGCLSVLGGLSGSGAISTLDRAALSGRNSVSTNDLETDTNGPTEAMRLYGHSAIRPCFALALT